MSQQGNPEEMVVRIGQVTSTQIVRPWRTTLRTVFQAFIGLCVLVPMLVTLIHVDDATPQWIVSSIAVSLAISGGVTRAMAMPAVDAWLKRFVPFLASQPMPEKELAA